MNGLMFWILILCDVLVVVAFVVTPFVTRKTELFGVSLPSAEIRRPELSAMRSAYLRMNLVAGAALIVLNIVIFLVLDGELAQVRTYLILLGVYCVATFFIYLFYHHKMVAFKATQPWRLSGASAGAYGEGKGEDAQPVLVVDTAPPAREVIHPAWNWLYAVVGGGTLLYLWNIWPSLPDKIPTNMDSSGVVDAWLNKGPAAFFTMISAQWVMIAVFIFVYFIIPTAKRQIDAAKPAESREQGRRFRYLMSACMVFCGVAFAGIVGVMPIAMAQSNGGMAFVVVPLVLCFVVIAIMLVVCFRAGQGGSRLKVTATEPSTDQKRMANTDDDRYWKLGVIYFNPADPAFFVEKRFGIGWTFNMGRPVAWVVMIGILAVAIVAIVLSVASG